MNRLQYRIFTIKNKHLQWAARLAVAIATLGFMAVMSLWAWAVLHPILGYSYLQVFFGWLVIGLAFERVQIAWREWRLQRLFRAHHESA